MVFRKLALASAALTLAVAPVAAQAAPSRAAAPITEESDLGGGNEFVSALIIILIAAIGMGALLLSDDDPVSP